MTVTQIIEWALYTYWARRLLPAVRGSGKLSLDWHGSLGGFGGLLLVGFAIGQMFTPASRMLIGSLSTLRQVAYFSIIITLAGNMRLIALQIEQALLPAVSEKSGSGDMEGVRSAYLRALRWTWLLLVPVAGLVMFLGDDFVTAWINVEFGNGVRPLLWPLVSGLAILYLNNIPSGVMQGMGRPRAWAVAMIATGLLNVTLGLILIPSLGAEGAAYAILLSGTCLTCALLVRVSGYVGAGFRDCARALDPRVVIATVIICYLVDHLPKFNHGLWTVTYLGAVGCVSIMAASPIWLTRQELADAKRYLRVWRAKEA
jgi:O-antigen/teichoic acid export membrane protein